MYIFLTDGRIDDLEQIKNYTKELALEIAVGKRNYLKLVLIGVGNEVDRYQLQELDDFDTGLDLDLWDYKIASEMTSLSQIFAEVINENQIIAENGSIYDDNGICVKSYPKGLPAKVDFVMRDDSQWFELEVNNQRIRQPVIFDISTAIAPLGKKKLLDFEIKTQEDSQDIEDNTGKDVQVGTLSGLWKILAGVLIGLAFVGTAIAFTILIKKSDDNKLQNRNQTIPTVIKESFFQLQDTPKPNSKSTPKSNSKLNPKDKSNNSLIPPSTSNLSNSNLATDLAINKTNNQFNSNNLNNNPSKESVINPNKSSSNKSVNNIAIANNSGNNIDNKSTKVTINNSKKTTEDTSININKSVVPISNPDVEVVVFFPSDESQLIAAEESKIDIFWAKIRNRKGIIQVSGHTDKTGDYAYNLELSQLRVNEVVRLLRDRGLDNNYQVTFEALSSLQPLSKQATAADNALNRRVVVQFKEK
jgi:outer membrane protein OmpA-like peptidoglycan-associated protein